VALNQFIVLKRKGLWAVKSNDHEQSCSSQMEAIHAAIKLANECGKNGKTSVVLLQAAKKSVRDDLDLRREPFSSRQVGLAAAVGGVLARLGDHRRPNRKRGTACGAPSVSEP